MNRARAAHAKAEAATDPRDKAAWKAAARTWERLSQPGVAWSLEPMRRELEALKREPEPEAPQPKAAPAPREESRARTWATEAAEATISF